MHYILTEKGIINKVTYYLPTELVEEFDGDRLRLNIFDISEQDANEKFKRDSPPSTDGYSIHKKKGITMGKKEQLENKNKNIAIVPSPRIFLLKKRRERRQRNKFERAEDTIKSLSFQHNKFILKKIV